ncbi:MAG: DUF4493 domain-containing protein [Bacteroidales bacterium]
MKRLYSIPLAMLMLAMGIVGCQESSNSLSGEGSLRLKVALKSDIESIPTKSTSENSLEESCEIKIYSSEGLIRKYSGLEAMPQELQLTSGEYSAQVTAGQAQAASFTSRYFKGETPFEIEASKSTQVEVICRIMNTLVKVNVEESFQEQYPSFQVEISSKDSSLIINQDNTEDIAYFLLGEEGESLTWTIRATYNNSVEYTHTGSFNALPTTRYDLNIKNSGEVTPEGGASVEIEVVTTPIEENETQIQLHLAPRIIGEDIELSQTQILDVNNTTPISFVVTTSRTISLLTLESNSFTQWGFTSDQISILEVTQEERTELRLLGLTFAGNSNEIAGTSHYKITLNEDLMAKITAQEGNHSIAITAEDSGDKSRSAKLEITVSASSANAIAPDMNTVFTSRAQLLGVINSDNAEIYHFAYRPVEGNHEWSLIEAQRDENRLFANVSGLLPATEYEYRIKEGDVLTNYGVRFTTEQALQLPNSSFENWSGTTPLLIYGQGESMFWDCGNHGSATMSKNVTEPDESIKTSGSKSIRLKSQFVGIGGFIGKFAAGNLFVGKYLKTDGTDGILGWGRPFASRPTALKGYIKYRPGVVDYTSTDLISKGDGDQGIVYVALGDWSGEEFEGEQWPVIVKTKSLDLFDPSENNQGTIAYGEYVLNSNTDGEEMIEFTIPLDYRDTRKPISLVLVASASRYGDYFSGSSNSTMWLDDLEFIYE